MSRLSHGAESTRSPLTVGGLFDGVGLLAYGLHLAGLQHAWLCEVDPWRRSILNQRFPGAPVFDDVRSVGSRTAEPVHVVAGGFPCKGASTAGKRNGFDHPETVLWREMARAIRELRPRYVLVENVANILGLHDGAVWGEVVGDLAALGFRVVWDCLPAASVGAPHLRDRVFAVAENTSERAVEPGRLRRGERGADQAPATDAPSEHRQAGAPARQALGRAPGRGDEPAPDADGAGRDRRSEQPAGLPIDGQPESPRGGEAAADTSSDGVRPRPEPERRGCDSAVAAQPREGVAVEWGQYAPAIRRWEAVHGPAPKPLVRRVDDRRARRVERSRLSALGDGVQVQVGQLAGAYIVELERQRLAAGGLIHAA